jgi:hypothetical protein
VSCSWSGACSACDPLLDGQGLCTDTCLPVAGDRCTDALVEANRISKAIDGDCIVARASTPGCGWNATGARGAPTSASIEGIGATRSGTRSSAREEPACASEATSMRSSRTSAGVLGRRLLRRDRVLRHARRRPGDRQRRRRVRPEPQRFLGVDRRRRREGQRARRDRDRSDLEPDGRVGEPRVRQRARLLRRRARDDEHREPVRNDRGDLHARLRRGRDSTTPLRSPPRGAGEPP